MIPHSEPSSRVYQKRLLFNPLRTVDGYSNSLSDATGLVDMYSRIPTSTQ